MAMLRWVGAILFAHARRIDGTAGPSYFGAGRPSWYDDPGSRSPSRMTVKRRRLLVAAMGLVGVACAVAFLLTWPTLSVADLDRSSAGMTLAEVESALGPPHSTGSQF